MKRNLYYYLPEVRTMKRYATTLSIVLAGMIAGGVIGVPASYWTQPAFIRLMPLSAYVITQVPQSFATASSNPISTSAFFVQVVYLTVALCSVLGGCAAFAIVARKRV